MQKESESDLAHDLRLGLKSADPLDRIEALEVICVSPCPEVFHLVLCALRDENALVRLAAAEALATYDRQEAREALRAYVEWEPDPLAAGYGLSTLGLIAEMDDLRLLSHELDRATSPEKQIHAAVGLATAALRVGGRVLARHLSDAEAERRHLAVDGLLAALQYVSPEVARALDVRLDEEDDPLVREKLEVVMQLLAEE